jgi:hypothetical protein
MNEIVMNGRPVKVYSRSFVLQDGMATEKIESVGTGIFRKWGCDYQEFESGPGNYSTAIVEMEDGSVLNVSADLIEFQDRLFSQVHEVGKERKALSEALSKGSGEFWNCPTCGSNCSNVWIYCPYCGERK